jgi:CarD family transcriptional regulator
MTFQIGEKVVYPNQGVGTVENISSRCFGGQFEPFYLFRLMCSSHVQEVGLRKVTRNGELTRVLGFLADGACPCSHDWKSRFKANSEKMRLGGLLQIAQVLKTLLLLQSDKPLSFREKKMLDRARHMLVSEISISRGMPCQAIALLQKALAKASLSLPAAL